MEKLCKTVIIILIAFTMGETTEDMEKMKEMMRDMNLRVSQAEEKLAITEDKLAEALNGLATTKNDILSNKNDILSNKNDILINKNAIVSNKNKLDSEISMIRTPPHMHACGYMDSYNYVSGIIPYSSLLYSSTNTEGGGLDISTGIFTSPYPGSYTVTWGLKAGVKYTQEVSINLKHNGNSIEESRHDSYYTGSDQLYEQGGRTIILHLDMGDTLALYKGPGSYSEVYSVTFCVSLSTYDII